MKDERDDERQTMNWGGEDEPGEREEKGSGKEEGEETEEGGEDRRLDQSEGRRGREERFSGC
jgi:hypothetical protein